MNRLIEEIKTSWILGYRKENVFDQKKKKKENARLLVHFSFPLLPLMKFCFVGKSDGTKSNIPGKNMGKSIKRFLN